MTLTLYGHPLSSFVQKVTMALYESGLPFTFAMVEFDDPANRESFLKLSPMGKMPALVDEAAGRALSETTIILEYLATTRPQAAWLLPAEPDLALQVRARDRFFDLYLQQPMQKVVLDRLRPEGRSDALGVRLARAELRQALDLVDATMAGRTFAVGDALTMADCAAAPALHYAHKVIPLDAAHPNAWAYYQRLARMPSYARCLAEAQPYLHLHPEERSAPAG